MKKMKKKPGKITLTGDFPRAYDCLGMSRSRTDTSIRFGNKPERLWARTLEGIMRHRLHDKVVRRSDLSFGDRVIITTRNSVYSLWHLGNGDFAVRGGWFERQESPPEKVAVNGCTYGGTAIRPDVIAARGLFLEFENRVLTTRIQDVKIVRSDDVGCVNQLAPA